MQRINTNLNHTLVLLSFLLVVASCKKEEYALPVAPDVLQNDAIKRSLGPNIVGQELEFAYAMAIKENGFLESASVEATYAGAAGTYMEHRSFFTDAGNAGSDSGIVVASPSVTTAKQTSVTFTVDTSAATLRYYYVIPEEARGQEVSFTFTAKSTNNETVTYKMGPYKIANMEMVRLLGVNNNSKAYISISDMKIYDSTEAAANPSKIDLVYLFRNNVASSAFNHALVSPAAEPQYRPGVNLPAGVNNSTRLLKVFNLQDYNLARLQFGIYIDDLDLERIDLSNAPNYALNLRAEAGVWAETADGKYKAYIYLNSVATGSGGSAVISMKRWTVPGK